MFFIKLEDSKGDTVILNVNEISDIKVEHHGENAADSCIASMNNGNVYYFHGHDTEELICAIGV